MRWLLTLPLILAACAPAADDSFSGDFPGDVHPTERRLAGGTREWVYPDGCVVRTDAGATFLGESITCTSRQRDLALLYAAGD